MTGISFFSAVKSKYGDISIALRTRHISSFFLMASKH